MSATYTSGSFGNIDAGVRVNTTGGPLTGAPTTGKLVLALLSCTAATTVTKPTGWTEVGTGFTWNSTLKARLYWKIAGGSEPSTYTWSHSSDTTWAAIWTVDGAAASPIDFSTSGITTAGTDPNASGTTTVANVLLFAAFTYSNGAGTTTEPSGFTEVGDDVNTFGLAHKLQAVAGATGTITYDTTTNDNTILVLFGVKSAVSPKSNIVSQAAKRASSF